MSRELPTQGYRGPYRLLSLINNGHASQLWKARRDDSQQLFAIKTLTQQYRQDRQQIGYLKWEHAVGAKLAHKRLIAVHEYNADRGIPYLSIEWFSAPNLKFLIRQEPEQAEPLVPKIVLQAAESLAYFNAKGFIHRDIKPENFLVAKDGSLKLIDFALAQRKPGFLGKIFARKGAVQGTPSYMSPEQIRCRPLDERADLYSLGCTFFELISGNPPFVGMNTNDLLTKHLKANPPSLESASPQVTPEFAKLIGQTLAKDVEARPQSMAAFLAQLRTIQVFRRSNNASGGKGRAGG